MCSRKAKNPVGPEIDCAAGKQRILWGLRLTVQQENKESCGD